MGKIIYLPIYNELGEPTEYLPVDEDVVDECWPRYADDTEDEQRKRINDAMGKLEK